MPKRETNLAMCFDTETTDLIDFKAAPWDQPETTQLIQLAAILIDCDDDYKEVDSLDLLIKTTVPSCDKAFDAHGITFEKSTTEGVKFSDAIIDFEAMLKKVDFVVAHNLGYDRPVMDMCSCRNYYNHMDGEWKSLFPKWGMCTMRGLTNICCVPHKPHPKTGKVRKGNKWPSLMEAYIHIMGKEFEGAHDAMNDTRALSEVFKYTHKRMCREGRWPGLWMIANKEIAALDG